MPLFINDLILSDLSWQAFERIIARLLIYERYTGVRIVGQTADGGADLLASRNGKRWLFQAKRQANRVGLSVVDKTLSAVNKYRADIPVIVSLNGFDSRVYDSQRRLLSSGVPLQLWERSRLISAARAIPDDPGAHFTMRDYQSQAVRSIVDSYLDDNRRKAMVVLATGLGKTFVAAEAVRRLSALKRDLRVLVVAHTNDLVYQLERSFWPLLRADQDTVVWNGIEAPGEDRLAAASLVFACLPSIVEASRTSEALEHFDVLIIDECHHAGSSMYVQLIENLNAGTPSGPYLLGLTATPWRADDFDLETLFGSPLISVDLVSGLRLGFLTNVDYRMFTDNIDWSKLGSLRSSRLSPRAINRTLFIDQWDDGVVDALASAWGEVPNPRAIVFCGTIDHAITMRDRVNARRFCRAEAIFSSAGGSFRMTPVERNRILADFQDGRIDVICAVDIFNEGIDVPDVNILVFQRVTHSRRIFIQQLGRGLRLADGKDKVIVLDFVSDIRRFAAGIDLQQQLAEAERNNESIRIRLPGKLSFRRLGGSDGQAESFLKQWLDDVAAIENAGEDASILKFPPELA